MRQIVNKILLGLFSINLLITIAGLSIAVTHKNFGNHLFDSVMYVASNDKDFINRFIQQGQILLTDHGFSIIHDSNSIVNIALQFKDESSVPIAMLSNTFVSNIGLLDQFIRNDFIDSKPILLAAKNNRITKEKFEPRGPIPKEFLISEAQNRSMSDPDGKVLAANTTDGLANIGDIRSIVVSYLSDPAVQLSFRGASGAQGPRGDKGDPGSVIPQNTTSGYSGVTPYYFPPQPSQNFNGASLFSATDLSSQNFTTNRATINTSLAVNGSSSLTGSLTLSSLGGGGVQCIQTDNAGLISGTGSACGAGGGSSALSGLTAGIASNSIDNTNNDQTWNWSTLTSQNALTLSASGTGLTSGSVLKVSSATTGAVTNGIVQLLATGAYTGTGGLLNVTASGTTSGTVAKITGSALTTGTLLKLDTGSSFITSGRVLDIAGGIFAPAAGTDAQQVNLYSSNFSTNTTGTSSITGINIQQNNFASGAGGTQNTYGINISALGGFPGAGTQNNYGIKIGNYGQSGAENSYGLYVSPQSGATNSYAAVFAGGNVGIGVTNPTYPLEVALGGNILTFSNDSTANISASGSITLNASGGDNLLRSEYGGVLISAQGRLTGNGKVQFAASDGYDDSNIAMTILTGGNVGIGTTTPVAALSLERSGVDSSYRSRTYSNTNWQGNYLVGDRAEGTSGTPLAVSAGDHLIGVTANAYSSGSFNFAGSFTFYVEGAPSGTNVPTYFTLWTTSTTGSGERLHVKSTGEIGVGTSGPDRQFEINSATGNNLRLTYNDSDGSAVNYADLLTTAGGNLTITPSGGTTTVTGNLSATSAISSGVAGSSIGGYNLSGNTSGTISILPQAAAGTYNFNLPTTAGSSGYVLTSGGGGATAMTWTDPSGLGVRWNALQAPTGSLSLAHGANTTAFSFDSVTTANAFSLTSSSLSSGSILNIAATGTAGLTGQKGINVSLSGANGTGAQTTYGGYFSNTHTGTSNNVGLYATATGGTNNYAAIFDQGNVGIGTTAPDSILSIVPASTISNRLFLINGTTTNATGVYWGPLINSSGSNVNAFDFAPSIGPSGAITTARGLMNEAALVNGSGNSITTYNAFETRLKEVSYAGTITTANAAFIRQPFLSSSSFPTTLNGVYIDNQGLSGIGTSYGLYVASQTGSTNNYAAVFAGGNVGVGTTTPTTVLEIGSSDLGNGNAGPVITLGRNTNATNTGAGSINFQSKAGTAGYVWQDNAGNMRINTAAPSNANDTAGTVIGTQTSTRETKQDITDYTDYGAALQMVADAPLHTFRYVKDVQGYGDGSPLAKARIGYIADEVPAAFMWGNSIDQVSVNGILMASVKALNNKIDILTAEIQNRSTDSSLTFGQPNLANTPIILASQLYLSGDNVGQAKILAGSTTIRVTFNKPYQYQPIVTATPNSRVGSEFWIADKDSTGFTIYIDQQSSDDIIFDWHSFAGQNAKLTVSDGSNFDIHLIVPDIPVFDSAQNTTDTTSPDSSSLESSQTSSNVSGDLVAPEPTNNNTNATNN